MTRKFAIGIAATLVAALMAGMVALHIGRGVVGASPTTSVRTPTPIVRTETKVITIKRHRPAATGGQQTITVVRPAPATVMGPATRSEDSHEHDDAFEDSGGDD